VLRALILALPLALVACASPTPTTTALPSSGTTPAHDALLLRYACERAPIQEPLKRTCWGPTFSLYGDGRAIYRDATRPVEEGDDGAKTYGGYRTVQLPPDEASGMLDRARARLQPLVDATPIPPSTEPVPIGDPLWYDRFAIDIGGRLVDLAPGQGPIPPSGVPYDVADIATLLGSWRPPTQALVDAATPYEPDRYCAWIHGGSFATEPWPWTDLRPEDFTSDPNRAERSHELTVTQARLFLPEASAGRIALNVRSPNGPEPLGLAVRALMPGETCDPAAF
jgi:hypothetical protein